MERRTFIEAIVRHISRLRVEVENSNALNLTDINIHAEDFYREFLNLVYGSNYRNMNFAAGNFPAIDLADDETGEAIQVTATSELSKVRKTVQAFAGKKLHETYDRLTILNIGKITEHKKQEIKSHCGNVVVCTKDNIRTTKDLLRDIQGLDSEGVRAVHEFLERQLGTNPTETVPKEIETFMRLIELLSEDAAATGGEEYSDEPDPEGKIEDRFAGHSHFLKSRYVELYQEYGATLDATLRATDIGAARIRRLGLHLKIESDSVLQKCNGDPSAAFDILEQRYADRLGRSGVEFDLSAIRFFLVDQLIKCNVFPNKEVAHV